MVVIRCCCRRCLICQVHLGVLHGDVLVRRPERVHDESLVEVDVGELRLEGQKGWQLAQLELDILTRVITTLSLTQSD